MTLPRLKTNAIAQYPLRSRVDYATTILHHVDGSEQRFPRFKNKIPMWIVSLDLLDDVELTRFREFFLAVQVSGESFSFIDGHGVEHANCVFLENELEARSQGEGQHSMQFTIRKKGGA
jgi:hypothetical protein